MYVYVYSMCIIMCMCLYVFVCVCVCMRMCVHATAGVIIRILVWSDKKQEVGWSSADIDQLFYITCTLEVRSYVNSTSMEATKKLLAS